MFSYYNYKNEQEKILNEIDHQLLQVAKGIKFILPRNFHDRALSQASINQDEDRKNMEILSKLAKEMKVTYIYTFVLRNNAVHFTSSSATDEDIRDGNLSPYWMEYPEATHKLKDTFGKKEPTFETATDRWGSFRSVMLPETSVSGQHFIIGVDHDIGYVQELLFYRILEVFIKLGFLLLLMVPFCIAIINNYKNYSKDLLQQVQERTEELMQETIHRKESEDKRKKLEQRLQLSQKLESLGTLAAGIAHEINTPIQFIRDNLSFLTEEYANLINAFKHSLQLIEKEENIQILREKVDSDEIIKDFDYLQEEIPKALEEANEGARRVSKIVRSIRIFSHVNENQGIKTEVDLNKSLEPAIFLTKNEWNNF